MNTSMGTIGDTIDLAQQAITQGLASIVQELNQPAKNINWNSLTERLGILAGGCGGVGSLIDVQAHNKENNQ